MQIGLKPDEVLDMSLDVFRACSKGYQDRVFDQQLLGVQTGYWAGYYQRAKKPTPLKSIIEKMLRRRDTEEARAKQKHVDEVDVEAFLAMEANFKSRMAQLTK